MSNKIHESINELIPYISENFITYPLWEEGKYIPFVTFWQIAKNVEELKKFEEEFAILSRPIGYDFSIEYNINGTIIGKIHIYPDFNDLDDGSYEFVNPDWSIEEMILLVKEFLNSKNE